MESHPRPDRADHWLVNLTRFLTAYTPDAEASTQSPAWTVEDEAVRDELLALTSQVAGLSLGGGLIRFVASAEQSAEWAQLAREAFPRWDCPSFTVVAVDWMGQMWVLDHFHRKDDEPKFLLIDLNGGRILRVPVSFREFFENFAVDDPAALEADELAEWYGANPEESPLQSEECLGYIVPPFLGGADDSSNYERVQTKFYWEFTGQLREASRG